MTIKETESRLPGGFTKESADQLGFASQLAGNCCLVSYLPQTIRFGDPLNRIINRYVLFIDAAQFAANTDFTYGWTFDFLTETDATLHTFTETDPDRLTGIYDFNSQNIDLDLALLPAFKKMRVTCRVIAAGVATDLSVEHLIAGPFSDIAALFVRQEGNDPPLGRGGNPYATHRVAAFFRDHFQYNPQWMGESFDIPMNIPLSILYTKVLKSGKRKNVYHKINDDYYDAVNADLLELFPRDRQNRIGLCSIKLHFLSITLGKTSFRRIDENGGIEEADLFAEFDALPPADKIDLYNYARFPRSSFLMCALMLQDIIAKAQAIQCTHYLGGTDEKVTWTELPFEDLKEYPDFIANVLEEYADGLQEQIEKIKYKEAIGKVDRHLWSPYIEQILNYAYADKSTAPRITDAYFARKVVAESNTGALSASFERLSESKLLYQEYIVLETSNMRDKEVKCLVRTGDTILTGAKGKTLELVSGDDYTKVYTAKVGDTGAFDTEHGADEYVNLDQFADKAVIKLGLRPKKETTYDDWARNIQDSQEEKALLELKIQPKDKSLLVYYGPEREDEQATNSPYSFLTEDDKKFTVAYFDKTNHLRVEKAHFTTKEVTPAANLTITLNRADEDLLGRRTYLQFETKHLAAGQTMTCFVQAGNNILTGTEKQALSLMNDQNNAVKRFRVVRGNTDALNDQNGNNPYANLADFAEKGVAKLNLRPSTRAVFNTWAQNIRAGAPGNAPLEIVVHVDQPPDNDRYVFYGEEKFAEVASNSGGTFLNRDGFRFTITNQTFYEVYNRDNQFVFLNPGIFIGKIENDEENNRVTYYYHDVHDNTHEICTCDLSRVRRRANGRIVSEDSNVQDVPPGWEDSQPAPPGGSAITNYYYANNNQQQPALHLYDDIITLGNNYGIRGYLAANNNLNDLVDLIRMPDALTVTHPPAGTLIFRIDYAFGNSPRRYCNPTCFAAFVGVLAQISLAGVVCNGMCFGDATSYPSREHPNGDSVDLRYFGQNAADQFNLNGVIVNRDQLTIDALDEWGFANIIVGTVQNWLVNVDARRNDHNDHLHAGNFNVNLVRLLNA